MHTDGCLFRGPEQLINEAADSEIADSRLSKTLSSKARARLQQYLEDGLGDHVLYLRLFQVRNLLSVTSILSIADAVQPRHAPQLSVCFLAAFSWNAPLALLFLNGRIQERSRTPRSFC